MNTADGNWASEPIAIIGMSCKFAGDATSPERLWKMLAEGRSAWSEIPSSRFNHEGAYHPNSARISGTSAKGAHFFEEDVGLFDAAFFNYSAETAATLDPQFRLQLESVYEALENAGLPLTKVAGSNTSVFAGIFVHDYKDGLTRDEDNLYRFYPTGTGFAMASNRISHFYDFRGASMTIDTGCSTTLVALHQAVQSLRSGEADMSVVNGANVLLNTDMFKAMSSLGFLSPDGKSFAFDSRANGYGRGEGVAAVVLKRLKDAEAAGDPIRAVIRESLLNQDGKTETITSPSQAAQETLMRECYRKARLDPGDTQYFEAHGTGTQTGDPIEARAIASIFQSTKSPNEPLLIGSIKTNIGHTETTSGLASIVKTVLAMEKGMIPPSINFEKPNPKLALEAWHLKIATEMQQWPATPNGIRRASVNNFGYGGSNSHVILERADGRLPNNGIMNGLAGINGYTNGTNGTNGDSTPDYETKLLILSARDENACVQMVSNMKEYLKQKGPVDASKFLESFVYTLGQRRTLFSWVAAYPIPCTQDIDEVVKALDSPKFKPSRTSRQPRIGMVFTGQGAQWHAMGRELIAAYPIFRASLEEADGYLNQLGADWSLLDELSRDADTSRVNETGLSIPICVALQISLVCLLRAWGIEPTAVTSHSSGEISAAYTAGAIGYRHAMAIAYYRSVLAADKCLRGNVKGGMIAIGLGEEDTERYLKRLTYGSKAVIACVNSPSSVTVAGDLSAVEEIEELAKADSVFARRLKVDTGYHSHHMHPIVGPYLKALRKATSEEMNIDLLDSVAFSSPVTGGRIISVDEIADPEHWVESLIRPVQFIDAFTDMILGDIDPSGSSVDVIVEVGPHTALGGPIRQILELPEFNDIQIPYFGCLVRNTNARDSMQALASSLLREGYPLNIGAINFPSGKPPHVQILTDLPSYPWNHQKRHWAESRLNVAIRERKQKPHDLLGSPVPAVNADTPTWRQIVRATEIPWIRDHVVQSNILYPGAGYICLAIEAVNQITNMGADSPNSKEISGYRLRDIDILQGLVIPDNADGIEIQTILRPASGKAIGIRGWKNFEISSVTADNRWTQHATGLIRAEFEKSPDVPSRKVDGKKTSAITGYTRVIDPSDLFANLRSVGINHGPMFRNIKSIVQSGKEQRSEATVVIADTSIPDDLPRSHVLHPTTLDSIVTAAYSALSGIGAHEESAKVPRSIEKLWVSSKISHEAGHSFRSYSTISHADSNSVQADVSLINNNTNEYSATDDLPVLEIQGLLYQSLGQSALREQSKPWTKEVCSKIEWGVDISLASAAAFNSIKKQLSHDVDSVEDNIIIDLRRVCLYYIEEALAVLTHSDLAQLESHSAKYYGWMQDQMKRASTGLLGPGSADWTLDNPSERQRRIELTAKASMDGELVCRLGPHIAAILRREMAPLELMMQEELLYKYYGNALKAERCTSQLAALMRHVVHKNPRARILEIGAGTGGGTQALLQALGNVESGGPLATSFHFTDVSSGFFEAARQKFQAWGDFLTFDKLDIEEDPAAQGFELGSYDIVISCQCLRATKSIARTMANVRSLMKPGGTLLLVETTQDQLDFQFSFGLLPDWWLSEEPERRSSPSLSLPLWDQILKDVNFTGVDIEIPDSESDMYSNSVMMSTARMLQSSRLNPQEIVIVTSGNTHPTNWVESLRRHISVEGALPAVHSLESTETTATAYHGKICVFVGELSESILFNPDAPDFEAIKAMTISCRGLLWVTSGGSIGSEDPQASLAAGFIRSLRNEYVGRRFLTLDLDPNADRWYDGGVSAIAQVLEAGFGYTGDSHADATPIDFEYAERNGTLMIPRFYKDMGRNKFVAPAVADLSTTSNIPIEPLYQPERPLYMEVATPGLLDTTAFVDDPFVITYGDSLPPEMIEIEPKAYGVNFRDVMVALGQLKQKVIGCECAGIITRVGSRAAAHGYAVGDRVFSMLHGPSYSSRARIEWVGVAHMPAGLSFEHAASIPTIYGTAYYSFVNVADLQYGQSVLIHAAAGGVGQAAIVIAQHLGAEIYATVGTLEKRELIKQKYGIPDDHIFNSRDTSFAADVLEATGGRGVDVVLNSLAGPLLQESFNVLAPFGHFIEIGKRDLEMNSMLEMHPFSRHVSFSSIDMLALMRKGRVLHRVMAEVARLVEDGVIKPVHPITVYPMAEVVDALRLLQAGKHMGKVVLSISAQEMVKVRPQIPRAKLSPTASYLLIGGVGGIGRSVAYWMVTRGAKNLILLSRSAGSSGKTSAFVAELEDAGCRVKPISCDVSDPEELSRALRTCKEQGLPPVKGVIQGAMVLQDSILEQMTITDYRAAIRPKVNGTWNLHKEFEQASLDFFVMLSSISGLMGLASQSNYSAGGAYEDALARWRVTQGLPAVSIDLGAVKAVGYVAETSSVASRVERVGHRLLEEELVLRALESAVLSPFDAQIIIGINSGPGNHWDPDGESQVGRDARFQALKYNQNQQDGAGKNGSDLASGSLGSQLAEVASREEAVQLIGQAIAQKLSEIFLLSIDDIDLAKPPAQYGVDSLVAVELRNMLAIQAAAEISIFGIMQCASLAALASDVVMKSRHMEASLLTV